MKTRILIALISLSFLSLLIYGCGKSEDQGGHFSGDGGGGGNMNFEQQALRMEQEDLAKLRVGENPHADAYAQTDKDAMKGRDFARIHEGVIAAKDPNEVIATVNGEEILRLELDRISDKVKTRMGKKRLHLAEERIIDDLVTQLVLKQFIRKQDIHIDSNRIEDEINTFRENIRNNPDTRDKSLETILEEQGGSVEELRVALDISFSIEEYLEKTVQEGELEKYFVENIGNFNGETVTASHILVDTRDTDDEEKLREAKEKIESLKEELDNGADFAELARKNSDCPSAANGGQLGVIARGKMVDEFEDVAFKTGVNGISEPVKTQFGYHIIHVTDKQEGREVKFEEEMNNVKVEFFNEKTIDLIQELQKNADIHVLYKPTPYESGSHGSTLTPHGGMHGGSTSSSPHGSGSISPHGGSYQGQMRSTEDESVENKYTLTN